MEPGGAVWTSLGVIFYETVSKLKHQCSASAHNEKVGM